MNSEMSCYWLPPSGSGVIAIVSICASCDAVSENVLVPLEPLDDWLNQLAPPEIGSLLNRSIAMVAATHCLPPFIVKAPVPVLPAEAWVL